MQCRLSKTQYKFIIRVSFPLGCRKPQDYTDWLKKKKKIRKIVQSKQIKKIIVPSIRDDFFNRRHFFVIEIRPLCYVLIINKLVVFSFGKKMIEYITMKKLMEKTSAMKTTNYWKIVHLNHLNFFKLEWEWQTAKHLWLPVKTTKP